MAAAYVPPTHERLIELAGELYLLGRENKPLLTKGAREPAAKVPAAFATARHAVETAKAGVDLFDAGNELVAMTLVRAALECTMNALWLVQSPEAIYGFLAEDSRKRQTLSREMAKAANESIRQTAGAIPHLDDETVETVAAPQARNFQHLCNAFRGGHEAYIHYRILSGMVHPCPTLTDYYLQPNDESPLGVTLRFEPQAVGHDSWLFLAVACMTWAARAIDHLDLERLHRSRLRAIARELGIPETLKLTAEAEQAVLLQQQQRRREAREQVRAQPE